MKKTMLMFAFSILLSQFAQAGDEDHGCDPKQHVCPPRPICLNLVCDYERVHRRDDGLLDDGHDDGFSKCRAASRFTKLVSSDGDEIRDRSAVEETVSLEVECDGQTIFNNSANRFTDAQGTRLQAKSGPYPAVVLPRGTLSDEHRYVASALELKDQILRGVCYVYPGEAFE